MHLYFSPYDIAYQLVAEPDDMRDVLATVAGELRTESLTARFAARIADGSAGTGTECAIAPLLRRIADALDAAHEQAR